MPLSRLVQQLSVRLKVTLIIEDAKALEWAMNHRADIISISWTCAGNTVEQGVGELGLKIQEAAKSSLIFCATGDKGPSAKQSYPGGFVTPFRISSCSISGKPSTNVEEHNTEFYLPAEDLDVDAPEYLRIETKEQAKSSSAATALAAGLATLILTLARFASYGLEDVFPKLEAIDPDTDVGSGYSETFGSRELPPRAQQAEDRVAKLKRRWLCGETWLKSFFLGPRLERLISVEWWRETGEDMENEEGKR